MSTQAITGTGEELDLSNLSLSRKEDFVLFAETPPRAQPEQLTRSQLEALSEAARADRNCRLRVWHANLGPLKTPQLRELHEDMWDIVDSNAQDGDKVKARSPSMPSQAWARPPQSWISTRSSTCGRSPRTAGSPRTDTNDFRSAGSD